MTSKNWQQKLSKTSPLPEMEGGMQNLVLIRGHDMEGHSQWAYALIPVENYLVFRQAEAEGNYHLADFGEVLHYGPGENPPEEIVQEMKEAYEANPKFEEELLDIMNNAFHTLFEAIENPENKD